MKWLNDATKGRIQHYNNVIIIVKSAVGLVTVCKSIYVFFYAEVLCDEIQNSIYSSISDLCKVIFNNSAQKLDSVLRGVYFGYS